MTNPQAALIAAAILWSNEPSNADNNKGAHERMLTWLNEKDAERTNNLNKEEVFKLIESLNMKLKNIDVAPLQTKDKE